jgi:hypothetical protein
VRLGQNTAVHTWWVDDSGGGAVGDVVATVLTIVTGPRVAALGPDALDWNSISEKQVNACCMMMLKNAAESHCCCSM